MINKVILVGRLGRDPEMRYTQAGLAVATFSLATNEFWRDKEGQKQERTEWHRIVVFGKTGEICGQYLSKGKLVYIEGRIQTREWTDKENIKRYTTEIVAWDMKMLDSKGSSTTSAFSDDPGPSDQDIGPMPPMPGGGAALDDIPF